MTGARRRITSCPRRSAIRANRCAAEPRVVPTAVAIVGFGLAFHAAQASTALAIAIGVVAVLAVLAVGIYQAALSGIYSAALYRYAVSHETPEGFRGTDLAHAFLPKR